MSPGELIGKYVIANKIGEGGMAEIYLATHVGPGGFVRKVALKRVREFIARDPDFVAMFASEARIVASLIHPNIVQVTDFDRTGETWYLAMEFVSGKDLFEIVKRGRQLSRRMPPAIAVFIAGEVAKGLGYAHRARGPSTPNGVIHRDVSPQNVLVSEDGCVKLTDFGIAKVGVGTTQVGTIKGKLAYMSPEQSWGSDLDVRSDVFALGIILWELLVGERLFWSKRDTDTLLAVRERPIPAPSTVNPAVPPSLDALVLKALQRDRSARFADGAEMAAALRVPLPGPEPGAAETELANYVRGLFPVPPPLPVPAPRPVASPQAVPPALPLPPPPPAAPKPPEGGNMPILTPPAPITDEEKDRPTLVKPRARSAGSELLKDNVPEESCLHGPVQAPVEMVQAPPRRRTWALILSASLTLAVVIGFGVVWATQVEASTAPPAPAPVAAVEPTPPVAAEVVPSREAPPEVELDLKPTLVAQTSPPPTGHQPAAQPRSTPKANRPASIHVECQPWCEVTVDGRVVGEAPGQWSVAPGPHRVLLRNADEHLNQTVKVDLVPGERHHVTATALAEPSFDE
jgi:serine/threonine protein kinase